MLIKKDLLQTLRGSGEYVRKYGRVHFSPCAIQFTDLSRTVLWPMSFIIVKAP